MHLESPIFLVLFAILPLLGVYLRWQRSNAPAIRIGEIQHIGEIPRSLSVRLLPSLKILRFIVISLLIIALARPQLSQSQERRFAEGIDIILALDISESMRAEDVKDANRLETAKSVIRDFLKHRVSDRVGLVVFSGESYTLCPLTLDYTVLIELLEGVEVSLGGQLRDGTAIGDAIATTTNRLQVSETTKKVSTGRIVILLTDGENNAGSIAPETAASLAQSLGIKVYTIGMGKEGGALIPYEDTTFGKRYREVRTYLDEGTLKRIANITEGRYFRATDVQSLRHVYTEIDQLEKTEFKVVDYKDEKEMAAYFLIPAALLFGLEVFLCNTVLRKIP